MIQVPVQAKKLKEVFRTESGITGELVDHIYEH